MRQPIDNGSELYPEDVRQLPDHKIRKEKKKHFVAPGRHSYEIMRTAIPVRPIRHLSCPERFVHGKPVFF